MVVCFLSDAAGDIPFPCLLTYPYPNTDPSVAIYLLLSFFSHTIRSKAWDAGSFCKLYVVL